MGYSTCLLLKLLVKGAWLITTGALATHKTQRQCGAERLGNCLFSLSAAPKGPAKPASEGDIVSLLKKKKQKPGGCGLEKGLRLPRAKQRGEVLGVGKARWGRAWCTEAV